jgi:hypothetical protein
VATTAGTEHQDAKPEDHEQADDPNHLLPACDASGRSAFALDAGGVVDLDIAGRVSHVPLLCRRVVLRVFLPVAFYNTVCRT